MSRGGVLGVLLARDEWPLLAVCAEHVLRHVDRLVVLDHASADATPAGLRVLRQRHGDRLRVLRLDDGDFRQEAATSLLLAAGGARDHDWVYVVDADEFVLTPAGTTLPEVLAGVDDDVDAVRYQLDHWVSTPDFAEDDPGSYRELRRRAVPTGDPQLPWAHAAAAIEAGRATWFDLPFPSKVLVRGRIAQWLFSGAHSVRWPDPVRETVWPPDRLRVAHLSLLSRDRLQRKAAHGALMEQMGYPPEHSWQNRLIHRVHRRGGLEEFWRRHTDGATTVPDDALVTAIEPAVAAAAGLLTDRAPAEEGEPEVDTVRVDRAVEAVHLAQAAAVTLAQRGADVGDRLRRLDAEHARLVTRHDALVAEHAALAAAYDELRRDREAVLASTSWRVTAPLREVSTRLRRTGSPSPS